MNMALKNPNSTRVTYAAVFIPNDHPDAVEYVLPAGIRRPMGFVTYDYDRHHKSKGLGKLCCGNCYAEGKEVEISHRKATAERIAGGEFRGHHATFAALPKTTDDHTGYCQDRRQVFDPVSAAAPWHEGIVININIPETYSENFMPKAADNNHHIAHRDPRFEGRTAVAVNNDISEVLKKITRFSRKEVQGALITVDGRIRTFRQGFIDGDGWQDLLREMIIGGQQTHRAGGFIIPHRMFLVTNPTSKHRREFNFASAPEKSEMKISCQQYEFRDNNGDLHIIQPSVFTSNDNVKGLFEIQGDCLVVGNFRYIANETKGGTTIHQIQISLESENLGVRLYNNPKRQIRDLEAMELLQRKFDCITPMNRKMQASTKQRCSNSANPGSAQPDLFSGNLPPKP